MNKGHSRRTRRFGSWAVCLFLAACLPVPPLTGDEPKGGEERFADDPAAHRLYDRMIEAMRKAESLSYTSHYEREAVGRSRTACTYQVWLKKPNYFRVESRTVDGEQGGILIGDGTNLWIHWPNGRPQWEYVSESDADRKSRFSSYMTKPAGRGRHSIWHEMLFLGAGMGFPILEPSIFHRYVDPIEAHLDGVRSLGEEVIGGEDCQKIEVSFLDRQRRWFLWLSKKDHLPRKLKEIVRISYDNVVRETWSPVVLNGDISDSLFTWKPPEGWMQWSSPADGDDLLEPGTRAPDFDLASIDGERVRLSDHAGKVVWLCFWRLGCPPCREEMPLIRDLYEKQKDDGFVVIGINVSDDRKLTLDFLAKQQIAFPSILDTSEAAQQVCHRDYGGGAVPLNYLVDRDGTVVTAGFSYAEVEASLKKLLEGR